MLSQQFLLAILLSAILGICPTLGQAFDCADKRCADMTSCAEAHYKFTVCGQSKRDGDSDGIPCENVCGDTMEMYRARLKAEGVELEPATAPAPNAFQHGTLPDAKQPASPPPAAPLTCAGKHRCSEMVSCAEARFYLTTCRALDGNHDGVPCEALCRSR